MFKPVVVDYADLVRMGWPYGYSHTLRLMQPTIARSRGNRRKNDYREWVEPNPDPFPQGVKLGPFRNSPFVWRVADVLGYFERHGLPVTEDWNAPDPDKD